MRQSSRLRIREKLSELEYLVSTREGTTGKCRSVSQLAGLEVIQVVTPSIGGLCHFEVVQRCVTSL